MLKLIDKTEKILQWGGYISVFCTVVIMFLLTIDALSTRFINYPIKGTPEIVTVLNVIIVWMITPVVQLWRGQQRVELFRNIFSKKGQLIIEMFSDVLSIVIVSFLAWRVGVYVEYLLRTDERVKGPLNFQIWPFAAAMGLGLIMLIVAFFITFLKRVKKVS
uniref:TRAP transporter small permease n=1 Tax=candidate division WOR-3 bacterium TaxID=2052148 RepID=A0A7C2K1C1_UNCW3